MESSVSPKDEIWFQRVCHHIPNAVCVILRCYVTQFGSHVTRFVESGWNVMAHGGAREGRWKGNWRMEWVASTLHTTSEHGVSSLTTADAHNSATSSRLNWRPCQF